MRFLGCVSKPKMQEECDQNVWNVFNQLDIPTTGWPTYFVEICASVSLKVATRSSVKGKKYSESLDF